MLILPVPLLKEQEEFDLHPVSAIVHVHTVETPSLFFH